jgi:hypothetical protein
MGLSPSRPASSWILTDDVTEYVLTHLSETGRLMVIPTCRHWMKMVNNIITRDGLSLTSVPIDQLLSQRRYIPYVNRISKMKNRRYIVSTFWITYNDGHIPVCRYMLSRFSSTTRSLVEGRISYRKSRHTSDCIPCRQIKLLIEVGKEISSFDIMFLIEHGCVSIKGHYKLDKMGYDDRRQMLGRAIMCSNKDAIREVGRGTTSGVFVEVCSNVGDEVPERLDQKEYWETAVDSMSESQIKLVLEHPEMKEERYKTVVEVLGRKLGK